ncbi:MAG TPA: hypothetical protein VJX67_21845 [Blastocatellia bacterium]|nr:hypothetical protein [Blastocatellia bacterium]
MAIKLQDIRRYAIEQRAEIVITGANGHVVSINNRGQAQIPDENKTGFRVDQVLSSATGFEIKESAKNQRLTPAEMAKAIGEFFKKKGAVADSHHEDE